MDIDSAAGEIGIEQSAFEAGRGTVVLDATAGSDAGIDIVSSEYATIAAENTALENLSQVIADQIVARLALYARRTGEASPPQQP